MLSFKLFVIGLYLACLSNLPFDLFGFKFYQLIWQPLPFKYYAGRSIMIDFIFYFVWLNCLQVLIVLVIDE